jgi:photosystem II stability/assembly factor-like uncharacterized protein
MRDKSLKLIRWMAPAAILVTGLLPAFAGSPGNQDWARLDSITHDGKPANLNAVLCDGDQIWIAGAGGLLLKSRDGGESFGPVEVRTDAGLNDLFVMGKRMWIVGDSGTTLKSTDGGRSFVKNVYSGRRSKRAGVAMDLYSVQFLDSDRGFTAGDEGLILATEDGGLNWREIQSGTDAQLFQLSFRGKHGWVVGTTGLILHTDDTGKNWYPQRSGTSEDLNRVVMVSDRTGFISGNKGTLLRTLNGGATWERVKVPVTQSLFGISFRDKWTGWVVGYKGVILRTDDGGRDWTADTGPADADLFSVSFNKYRGIAIGRDGLVLRCDEGR